LVSDYNQGGGRCGRTYKPPPANDEDLAGFPDQSGKQCTKAAVSINACVAM